jgi:HK97 family phage prohead protease
MTVLTPDMFVKPVEGHDDLIAFQYGFGLAPEGKASVDIATISPDTITELEDGDLLIEGWAANFDGIDRDGENFAPGAFQRGIENFLRGQAALCYHHKSDHGIGSVVDLKEVEGKGLYMKARVDHQPESSPLRYIYNGIKKGTYKGLSVGGFFKRAMTTLGQRIADVDMTEISVTPVPVHAGTGFNVVAGKALDVGTPEEESDGPTIEDLERAVAALGPLVGKFEEFKALPKSYDASAASTLAVFLQTLGQARSFATGAREFEDNEELISFANDVESQCVTWEATAHKLAAKVGPLPPGPVV